MPGIRTRKGRIYGSGVHPGAVGKLNPRARLCRHDNLEAAIIQAERLKRGSVPLSKAQFRARMMAGR